MAYFVYGVIILAFVSFILGHDTARRNNRPAPLVVVCVLLGIVNVVNDRYTVSHWISGPLWIAFIALILAGLYEKVRFVITEHHSRKAVKEDEIK